VGCQNQNKMKSQLKCIILIVVVLAACSCKSETRKKDKVIAEKEENQKELQEQLDVEFGEYTEEADPKDREYYKAYDKALALWKIPFHELYIHTSLGKAHVIACGPKNAEPLILLHGMNASSTMWYPNIKALSQDYRVYAIDYLLEPGKSQTHAEVKNMNEIMNWYTEIFDRLNLGECSLIGASEGGWLAVHIALHHKSRIRNLILLSPLQTFIWIRPGSKISSDITYSMAPKRKYLRSVLKTMSVDVDKIEKAYIDQYFIATQKAKNNLFMLQMIPFSDHELETLTMPVLVLVGDHDIINNEKSIDQARELLPDCETGIIKNAGHFLSIDQSETVNTRILEFLHENSTTHVKGNAVN
jgi:pimeloyl-ACP methyl ester carboxylesterase